MKHTASEEKSKANVNHSIDDCDSAPLPFGVLPTCPFVETGSPEHQVISATAGASPPAMMRIEHDRERSESIFFVVLT